MRDPTRRNILIAGGAGAALGLAAAAPGVAAARTPEAAPATLPPDAAPLMAHIENPSSGTLTLFVGEREVLVHDHDLVARLTRAAAGRQ